jgi:transcription antitermination factor NusG
MDNEAKWYAVYTKPRWEKKIAATLSEKGIENYCPLNKVLKQWSDRKKLIMEPLFKSYVFVKVSAAQMWEVSSINGVLNYVYWLNKPAVIREEEIVTIKKFLNEFDEVQVETFLQPNTTVVVKKGVMMNYKGILIEVKGQRAKVRIESMGLGLYAEFDKSNLAFLKEV